MKVAICGYPPLALQLINNLKNIGVECTHFISDFVTNHGEKSFNVSPPPPDFINFFKLRKFISTGKIDGVIIAENEKTLFAYEAIKTFKLYEIPNVGIINLEDPFHSLRWLDSEKIYMRQLEANVTDSCNLNCKACTHYSNIFGDGDFYSIDDYARDIRQIANCVDVADFYILGGEPFKLKNLDEYLKLTRKFLPNTNLRIVTNGLLIPNTPQYILDALRENQFVVDISMYPPTVRMIDQIADVFKKNNIPHNTRGHVRFFNAFLSLRGGHNPQKSRAVCCNDVCRFLRNGKIYKCPVDALSFKFAEHFGLRDFPAATGVDIFAKNFSSQVERLDGNVELCTWCNETARQIAWTPENNPKLTDWLAAPSEIENFLPK